MNKHDEARARRMRTLDAAVEWVRLADTSTLILNLCGTPSGGVEFMFGGPKGPTLVVKLPGGEIVQQSDFMQIVAQEIDRRMPRMEDA